MVLPFHTIILFQPQKHGINIKNPPYFPFNCETFPVQRFQVFNIRFLKHLEGAITPLYHSNLFETFNKLDFYMLQLINFSRLWSGGLFLGRCRFLVSGIVMQASTDLFSKKLKVLQQQSSGLCAIK